MDVDKIFDLSIKHIYDYNVDRTKYAIVYIMEDLFRKFKQSKQNKDLLLSIHSALLYNLKLVLFIIKQLCDINNNLEIKILTHRQKYQNEDYLTSWHHVSSGVTNTISLHFVWYDDNSTDGPLHDRYWICSDEENDEHKGITLCSVDSLGQKNAPLRK